MVSSEEEAKRPNGGLRANATDAFMKKIVGLYH